MPEVDGQFFLEDETMRKNQNQKRIQWISTVAILSAMAVLFMFLEIPLWFAPSFYTIDLGDVPALIGAFTLGPVAGIAIEAIKVTLFFVTHGAKTFGVGEIANFLIGISLVVPASLFYVRHKSKKHAIIGLVVGTVFMTLIGSILNATVLLPFYAMASQMNVSDFVAMGTAINPHITNLTQFILFAVVPFNLIKGALVSLVVILIYKRVSFLIKGRLDDSDDLQA